MKRFICVVAMVGAMVGMGAGAAGGTVERPAAGSATRPAGEDPVVMLRKKLQEVTALAEEKSKAGEDVTAVKRLVAAARTAVSEGKLREANQALDRALGMLKPQQ